MNPSVDPRVLQGVAEFNRRQYFEAHEFWEEVWLETVGPERLLLQGLIQIAAGYLKAESGNQSATVKLFTKGLQRVRPYLPRAMGLDLQAFVAQVEEDLRRSTGMSPVEFQANRLIRPLLPD